MKERESRVGLAQKGAWTLAANAREESRGAASAIIATGGFSDLALPAPGETPLETSGRGELARIWAPSGAFEWVAFAYLAFSSVLIFAFQKNLTHPRRLIGAQAIAAALIFILCSVTARAERRARQERVTAVTR